MKLKKETIKELREKLENKLSKVHLEKRISISPKILEQLLFETRKTKDGKLAKFIVWSGPFLKNIDLSKVSFYSVAWGMSYPDEFVEEKEVKRTSHDIIDLSFTNANIYFSNSFDVLIGKELEIKFVNLGGVDLSNSNFEKVKSGEYCNFSTTNLKFKDITNAKNYFMCDFSFNNFSNIKMDSSCLHSSFEKTTFLSCNFKNTELEIIHNEPANPVVSLCSLQSSLVNGIQEGRLDGCYVNGVRILSKEEQEELKQHLIKQYKKFEENIIQEIEEELELKIKLYKGQ